MLLFFTLINKNSYGQWNWLKSGDGAVQNWAMGVCNDASGNVYITGGYEAPILSFGTYTFGHNGAEDIFLVKYSANGNIVWAKREGGTGYDQAYSVTTDKSGNVYITGYFTSSQISFGAFTLINKGDVDFFVVKYDPNGNVLWARSEGGNNSDPSFTVKTDSQDNVYITGYTTSTPLVIGNTTINSNPSAAYVVKYDANGNLLWAKGANAWANGYALTIDNEDNVFITGGFGGVFSIDNYTVTNNPNDQGHFLIKLDSDGNVLWGKHNYTGYGYGLSTNTNGDIFLIGTYYTPTISIGTYTLANTNTEQSSSDIFLAKYDKNGNVAWAKSFGGIGGDMGYSVATDASNVYLVGSHATSMTIGNYTLPAGDSWDALLFARMDFEGNVNFAASLKSGGGDGNKQSWICVDDNGNAYIAGHFKNNPFTAGTHSVSLTGMKNVYLAKYHFNDVGLDEHKTENSKISIVPNPNDGHFTIQLKGPLVQEAEISIFDITGKEVLKQPAKIEGAYQLNFKDKPGNGLYLVKIRLQNGMQETHKLIISR